MYPNLVLLFVDFEGDIEYRLHLSCGFDIELVSHVLFAQYGLEFAVFL